MIWLGNNDLYEGTTTSVGVSYYNDTEQDLETWVNLKVQDIKTSREVQEVESDRFTYNDQPMIMICANGSVTGSPAPACFTYLHAPPYMLELRTEGRAANSYGVLKSYSLVLASNFHLISNDYSQWADYLAYNSGFQIKYPDSRYVKEDSGGDFTTSFMFNDGGKYNQLLVNVSPGYTGGAADFWYESVKTLGENTTELPLETYIQGQKCLESLALYDGFVEIICKNNSRLYDIRISAPTTAEFDYLFKMLSSLQFVDNKFDSTHYLYKDEKAEFQFVYPTSYVFMNSMAMEYSGDMIENYGYVGFSEYEYNNMLAEPPVRSFSVNYFKTELSLDGCTQNQNCSLFGYDFSKFSDTTFRGSPAKDQSLRQDYGNHPVIQTILFKRGDYIFVVSVGRADQNDNEEVDGMLSSFRFIDED